MNTLFIKQNYLNSSAVIKYTIIFLFACILISCASKNYDVGTKENIIPMWYMQDKSSPKKMYSKGTATSPSLELAVLKALNLALSDMAVKVQGNLNTISSQINSEQLDKKNRTNNFDSKDQINKSVQIEVKDFTVPAYKVVKKEAFIDKNKNYRVYMLLEFAKLEN